MKIHEATTKRRPWRRAFLFMFFVGIAGVIVAASWGQWGSSAPPRRAPSASAVPVTVSEATRRDVPIVLDALGTVQASNTIAIRSRIDGTLQAVNFVEGQEVHKGDTLALIDPRALQAALDQAVAKKAQDTAQLIAAQKDLDRFKALAAKSFETQQNLDRQQGLVDQLKASIAGDQGAIENAQTQLSYATITAPIDGRIGFRQVDAGNVIHANDAMPLTVLTQIRPSNVVFTLPQKNLGAVREAMLGGAVPVIAFDQDNTHQLAQGELLLIDNQIDQTTSTIRLKARFPNNDDRLWPGEFVRLRLQVDVRKDAVTVPPPALQRGPQGFYTWVIKPDNTAEQRSIQAIPIDNDVAVVTKGLSAGERVVVNGQYRLQAGARVESTTDQKDQAKNAPDKAS
jgi:multidrug efflux system membrane fusion protein